MWRDDHNNRMSHRVPSKCQYDVAHLKTKQYSHILYYSFCETFSVSTFMLKTIIQKWRAKKDIKVMGTQVGAKRLGEIINRILRPLYIFIIVLWWELVYLEAIRSFIELVSVQYMAWKTKLVSETTYIELHYAVKICVIQLNGILLLNL